MSQTQIRRRPAAYLLVLSDRRWIRSALFRRLLALGYGLVATIDVIASSTTTWRATVPLLACATMSFGSYLAWRIATVSSSRASRSWDLGRPANGREQVDDRLPIIRWLISIDDALWDRQTANASGIGEFVGVLLAGAGLYSLQQPLTSLLALGLALSYLASACVNLCIDPSLFLPDLKPMRWFEGTRTLIGPIGVAISACLATPAFGRFDATIPSAGPLGPWQWASIALCATFLGVGIRVAHLESVTVTAARLAETRQQLGRKEIGQILHGEVTLKAKMLHAEVQDRDDVPADVRDAIRDLDGLIREMHYLENYVARGLRWPGVLRAKADELLAKEGLRVTFSIDEHIPISPRDRQIARAAFAELTGNALGSNATTAHCEIRRVDARWILTLSDDGDPIDPARWKRRGGGLERFEQLLVLANGTLERTEPKAVHAMWQAADDTEE